MENRQTQCPHCSTMSQGGASYCGSCGRALSQVCGNCWTENPLTIKFCLSCGTNLTARRFCVPGREAEDWASKFSGFKWPRIVDHKASQVLSKATPALGSEHETVIAVTGIRSDYWLAKVTASGHAISASWPGRQFVGTLVVSNCRLLIADFAANTPYAYQYMNLQSAHLSDNGPGRSPVFSLDFGSDGMVELHRSRMKKFPIPFPSAYLLEATAAAASLIKQQQDENWLVDSFFQFLINSRRRLKF